MALPDVDDRIRSFCRRQRELLELELAASSDVSKSSSANGNAGRHNSATSANKKPNATSSTAAAADEGREQGLHRLRVDDVSIGLYGRTVLRLVPMAASAAAAGAATSSDEGEDAKAHDLLSSSAQQALLPAHRFTTGDEVEIRSALSSKSGGGSSNNSTGKGRMVGVICEVSDSSLSVALGGGGGGGGSGGNRSNKKAAQAASTVEDEVEGWAQPPLSLLSRDSVEVHRKLVAALDRLERDGANRSRVVRALMDPASVVAPVPPDEPSLPAEASSEDPDAGITDPPFVPVNSGLDDSQRRAVAYCLDGSCPLACVWGPPGTGKTTTIVEVIKQAVARQWKVLVTAPSNVAVDNVLAKLVATPDDDSSSAAAKDGKRKKSRIKDRHNDHGRIRAVRIGHPARMRPEIVQYSLDSLVQRSEGTAIVADVRNELRTFVQMLSSSSKRRRENDRAVAKREISSLRREIRTREEKVVAELLGSAQVVLATCVGAANRLLADAEFDMVVIDEAAQSLEVACWIPALLCTTKLVLAGDHKQLPPTIKSTAVQRELGYTMFERIMDQAPSLSRMLQVQYRMHETIADWASHAMYQGQLVSHETVRHRTLEQLVTGAPDAPATTDAALRGDEDDENEPDEEDTPPFLLIDTAGCGMHENVNPAGSRYNVGEAEIVTRQVRHLVGLGLKPEQIAVITPYNGQVETLRNSLSMDFTKLDIRSVDGFQGGEREAVLISLVRSSPGKGRDGIGFLSDERRLNVAITRSKRHCCVVCDSDTVQQSRFIKGLLDWISENGHHQSAREYLHGEHAHEPRNSGASLALKNVLEHQKESDPEEIAKKQALLVERIRTFAANGKPGAEMKFGATLSRFDRKVVHDEAERLDIGHVSEGVDGINRRIKLFIPRAPKETTTAVAEDSGMQGPTLEQLRISEPPSGTEEPEIDNAHQSAQRQSFQVLAEVSIEDSDELEASVENSLDDRQPQVAEDGISLSKSLLADLARERMDRQRRSQDASAQQPATKAKRVGGKKLGGSTKSAPQRSQGSEAEMVEMDDMAFLDQQIEQVQNAHGRKYEGKGGYRTVMNGILNSTPKAAAPAKNDPRASAALQAKLKSAQDGRKAKSKKR